MEVYLIEDDTSFYFDTATEVSTQLIYLSNKHRLSFLKMGVISLKVLWIILKKKYAKSCYTELEDYHTLNNKMTDKDEFLTKQIPDPQIIKMTFHSNLSCAFAVKT